MPLQCRIRFVSTVLRCRSIPMGVSFCSLQSDRACPPAIGVVLSQASWPSPSRSRWRWRYAWDRFAVGRRLRVA
jgi:hypothetical protein